MSETTEVKGIPWSHLKKSAMDTELEQQPWYKEYSKDDKVLLARLIKAQSDQGDNKPLKIETIESGLFPDPSIANILAPYD